ncbi:MAG TPA: sigma-70 family RNA polymerase sigma factor [Verrucomicrobiota bacterium]|nr:sigma-70 family RNA polymerase sigma factor [Verrucomicrobiales bacterium]HRI12952.1 sigma-70 family RNA polymerase sigma factor [Verrucomicrobiota bacterium]
MTSDAPRVFATTRWTLVFAAADLNSRGPREEFAKIYWFPLYAYARRRGEAPQVAEDAVQSFLGRLLNDDSLRGLSREGGRLRDFLRAGLDHELTDVFRASAAAKRRPTGGFVFPDGLSPEARLALEPADGRAPDRAFDRECARALLDATADRLQREFEGQLELFQHLLACLNGDPDRDTHRAAARRFGIEEGTLRNRVTAFRGRFRELFRQQVAATLDDSRRVEDEIRHLLAALAE